MFRGRLAVAATRRCPINCRYRARTVLTWKKRVRELAVRRQPARWAACRSDHEPAAYGPISALDPYVYLKDVLERLPTQPAWRIRELLPHRWAVAARSRSPFRSR